jgi:hypothetical protein
MTKAHAILHRVTHRIPGVPAHTEQPAGHQHTTAHDRPQHHGRNHSLARPPRFMSAWQRRVAALFGQQL